MPYETVCELVLRKDGRTVLDPKEARLLGMVGSFGTITIIAKRSGMTEGEVAGRIDSLNRSGNGTMVTLDETGVYLTEEGRSVLDMYRLREKVLESQLENMWRRPWLTTDGIILMDGKIVLIKRGREPFKGEYALPGGFVEYGELVEDSVVREVREETGLDTKVVSLSGVYSDPERDPRGHFVTIAFRLEVVGGNLKAGDDASGVRLFDVDDLPDMAADHRRIVDDALGRKGTV